MEAGRLDQRCTIKRPVRTSDAIGGTSIAWQRVTDTWCSAWPMTGSEGRSAGGTEATVNFDIRLRRMAAPDLAPDHRIEIGGRVFEIVSVLNIQERGTEWRLLCIERLA